MSISEENKRIIKRIFKLLKPYFKKISVILICIIASAGINMLYPLISKQVMDNGLLKSNMYIVVKFTLITFAMVLIDQAFGLLETKYFSYVNSMFQYSLQKMAFKHLLKLKLQYFNNTNFSEIMGNVGMDVSNMSRVCDRATFIVISQIFRIIGGLVGLLMIDWRLTIVVVFVAPVRYITVKYLAKKRKDMIKDYIEYNREYSSWYGDAISGVKEIKLMGIQRIKIGEFIRKQKKLVKMNIKMAFLDKFNEYSESIIFQVINGALYILGAYIAFKNGITIGGLFAFLTYSAYVIGPISAILNIGYNFSNVIPSAKRFFEFLDMETETGEEKKCFIRIDNDEVSGQINFKNVGFSYRAGERILHDINLEIKPGEKIAIIGANGSGKSTLINMLLRFYKPDEGKIELDGTDINSINLKDYRNLISVVSQDLYLFNASIEENISLGLKRDEESMNKAASESGAYEFIKDMPLKFKSEVGRNGSNLSGGQRQKIAVARAFARDSKILILDEATANYDVESEAYLNELITSVFKEKTVLVISHKPDILTKVDKIWVLNSGSISEYIGYDDFESNCTYKKDFLFEGKTLI